MQTALHSQTVHQNMSVAELVERAIQKGEGTLTVTGALSVRTQRYTGRSPNDRFIVQDEQYRDLIDWGQVNRPIEPEVFDQLLQKTKDYLTSLDEVYEFRGFVGADPAYRLPIKVINEFAWQNLFAQQLFIRPTEEELKNHRAEFTIIAVPGLNADPQADGTNSEAFVVISFEKRIVLIGGTCYAGEIKKSIFSVMNFLLPQKKVLSMHCSANVGKQGDVALFFGLSGTGKTTLSADPKRKLVGDDEHGWSKQGIFNLEGGCYAKCIHLSPEKEPQIHGAIRFGAVVENVMVKDNRVPDYDDNTLTENTRAAYPLSHIPNAIIPSEAPHPQAIVFLTADAFGVLPPVSILDYRQAMYHFLSGYTSKLAGTERGVKEPQATFSACFGAPFLPLRPTCYAKLLGEKIQKYKVPVFLINTGWTGGPYGVGKRMNLAYTRAMVSAALTGRFNQIPRRIDPIFNVSVPTYCPGVPDNLLDPRSTWQHPESYDEKARELATAFQENFAQLTDTLELSLVGPTV